MMLSVLRLLAVILVLLAAGSARAQTAPLLAAAPSGAAAAAPAVDPAALSHLLQTLQDPKERDRLIADLEALQAIQQHTAEASAPVPGALGAKLLQAMSDAFARLRAGVEDLRSSLGDPAHLWASLSQQITDPGRRGMLFEFLWQLAVILAGGFLADLLVRRVVQRSQARLRPSAPPRPLPRAGLLLAHSALELLPILAFAAAAYVVVAVVQPGAAVRLALLAIVSAAVIARGAFLVCRFLFSPFAPSLRLLPIDDETAAYIYVWAWRMIALGVYGYFLLQVAILLGLPQAGYELALRVLVLVIVLLVAAVILQSREPVARLIARGTVATPRRLGSLVRIRRQLARSWHVLALIYLAAVFLTWASGVPGGFAYLWHGTGLTVLILAITWLALAVMRRGFHRFLLINRDLLARYPLLEQRTNRYLPVLRTGLTALIRILSLIMILDAWQVNVGSVLESRAGEDIIARAASILLMLAIALVIWEVVNAAISFYLERRDKEGRPILTSSRARTLLPLVRNAVLVVISILVGLTILSELGVNIAPLLAGAGVVGLAIGFGAQTLVKDVITGAFILFEDTVNVGDVVAINGIGGQVEAMSIRTIKLRDGDGTLHTIPFGAVGAVSNQTRGHGYYAIDVGVALREDPDRVMAALREVFDGLARDPLYRLDILGSLDMQGVDRFTDNAVRIRARIKTRALRQWDVGREFNRRMKLKFDELGIAISPPQRLVYVVPEKAGGSAAPAPAQHSGAGG